MKVYSQSVPFEHNFSYNIIPIVFLLEINITFFFGGGGGGGGGACATSTSPVGLYLLLITAFIS